MSETFNTSDEAGNSYIVTSSEDFDDIAERIVKLFAIRCVSVSLPDDDEIEKKAEFRQKPRNPNNDNKEESIYGFMQGADWMKSEIVPNEH